MQNPQRHALGSVSLKADTFTIGSASQLNLRGQAVVRLAKATC